MRSRLVTLMLLAFIPVLYWFVVADNEMHKLNKVYPDETFKAKFNAGMEELRRHPTTEPTTQPAD
ncbi:MAG: hypothetical protein JWN40_3357 [Phycisphaerales bacterium]|nr:hypothetical protein [Phycisphaerales bacterium]